MDTAIWAAIIGAIAVILVALINRRGKPLKNGQPISRQLYILGMNIAKVGWAKAVPNSATHNILVSVNALLGELRFPIQIIHEFESFADKNESLGQLKESLPQIKNLFGNYLTTKYGNQTSGFFIVGFNLVNICPMFELASFRVNEGGPVVIDMLNEIMTVARAVDLPTVELGAIQQLVKKGIAEENGNLFDQARSDLIKLGEHYIDILEN